MGKRLSSPDEIYNVGDKLLYDGKSQIITKITMMTRSDNTGEVSLWLRDLDGRVSESVTPFKVDVEAIQKA